MSKSFQCQICPKSYNDAQGFLDHFEIHTSQNETKQDKLKIANQKDKSSQFKSENVFIEETMNSKLDNSDSKESILQSSCIKKKVETVQ